MVHTDPIADMLTRIRNANMVHKDHVDVPNSKVKVALARILKDEGFIKYYKVMRNNKQGTIRVFLKYGPAKEKVINGLERISKPGIRRYIKSDEIPRVRGGLGIVILSTSSGIMTGREARRQKVGGEILCTVW
ncbi:MAG: small subunit ribosomal protein [Candidatus Sumerlaeota bacterium]|nr:small subunit ribosomal protein [Candidatus Sumerlaeota bacterium]